MKLYFLRHGEADWPNWDQPDDERPLTKKGKKEMKRVAEFFAALDSAPAILLSSPLPRAVQTAKPVAKALGLEVGEEESLRPGFDAQKLGALLKKYQADQDLMLVGHEPDFTNVISALSGAKLKLSKAGLACVAVDDPNQLRGTLMWLIPPKISAA